ncbi:MAG: response regulator [Labilithrix sp.]|nr:response regulator [Labilithrix sp.]MCW5810944.1 response regulator [Labilithrix sp.]
MKIVSDQLLTSSEVGELLQVNPSSVKKWVDDGLLLAFRTPGGHRRIRAADLVSFLVRHEMPIPADLQDAAKKRLLIVDDEVDQLKALSRSFKRFADRVEVTTTSNGIDALVLVGSFHPHAVLLDVYMPGIDGLEVCRRLKKAPATKDVAVYVVSGAFTSALEQKALEAGAVKCLAKPIDARQILALMYPARGGELEARAH